MKIIGFILSLLCIPLLLHGQEIETVLPAFNMSMSFPNIRDFTMSSDSKEAYITVQSPLAEVSVIMQIEKADDHWVDPALVPFSGKYFDLEPFLSKDDLRLYFVSNRPIVDTADQTKDFDIWYVERKNINSAWGKPINLGPPVNTSFNEFYPSAAQNNNLYFTSDNPKSKGKDDLFFSAWKNSEYAEPVSLSDSVNTAGYEFNAFVSKDEAFIIFSGYNRDDGLGSGDLYISFRDENNNWSKAVNLGKEINSKYMDYCPFVDLNSSLLYFTSKRSSINEINDFQSVEDVIQEFNKEENGMSKIYKVHFDTKP